MTKRGQITDGQMALPAQRTRAMQIYDAFERFHLANPHVYRLFARFATDVARSGKQHYSSNAIFERIRWHMDIETRGEAVKLNNNYRPYYARLFHLMQPELAGFFRNRRRTSVNKDAHEEDIQVFDFGPAGLERDITDRLAKLVATLKEEEPACLSQ